MCIQTTYGVDIDGVLRDLNQQMINIYNKEFNTKMEVKDIFDFDVELSFPLIYQQLHIHADDFFFNEHDEIFLKAKPIGDVHQMTKSLHDIGRIIIVSYQKSLRNKTFTLEWLEKNNVVFDDVCFVKDKTIVKTDYLIDDCPKYFLGSNAKHGILISQPYNEMVDCNSLKVFGNCEDITRMDSFEDFVIDQLYI